ncbi:MAG: DUF262 domain-containing protein [Harvfovirus sp.]|uniref:DUF262 domain-containing protein n=1 Tax=Harvfovirus sp. TaxID=2487768 RepID=A0A3G5A262_9VIRU|nr:MAG: DUF262 domain-containing protein [Harvfovirus sp.]
MDELYTIKATCKLKEILDNNLVIPYNQRSYVWNKKHICDEFFTDIYNDYIENKQSPVGILEYVEVLFDGYSIIYVWDGQQRTITLILFLCALSEMCKKENINENKEVKRLQDEINYYLFKQILTEEEEKILEEKGIDKIPRLKCVREGDNNAIINILNFKKKPVLDYYEKSEEAQYLCKNCGKSTKTESSIIKHLMKCMVNDNIVCFDDNNIYKGYHHVKEILNEYELTDIESGKKFFKYLKSQIICDKRFWKNTEEAAKAFDRMNNRGLKLTDTDIMKNMLLSQIKENMLEEYHEQFEVYLEKCKLLGFKQSRENIILLCLELVNNTFYEKNNVLLEKLKEKFKNKIVIEKSFKLLNDAMDFIIKIYNDIMSHKFGNLIIAKSGGINWEIFQYIFVPFHKKFPKENNDTIIKIMTGYYIRTISNKFHNFNVGHKTKLRNFGNDVLDNKYKKLEDLVIKIREIIQDILKYDELDKEKNNFVDKLKNKSLKNDNATRLLKIYQISKDTDGFTLTQDGYDLEHIMSIKGNEKCDLLYNIGNLTLFEKANSENGHKGNRCLKNKPFADKVIHYKESSLKITRDLVKYTDWDNESIEKRSSEIVNELDKKSIKYIYDIDEKIIKKDEIRDDSYDKDLISKESEILEEEEIDNDKLEYNDESNLKKEQMSNQSSKQNKSKKKENKGKFIDKGRITIDQVSEFMEGNNNKMPKEKKKKCAETRYGAWCRKKCKEYHDDDLDDETIEKLENIPGWSWEKTKIANKE